MIDIAAFQKTNESKNRRERSSHIRLDIVKDRIRFMPQMMNVVFLNILGLLNGNTPDDVFRESFLDNMVPLNKRVNFGKDCEAYRESYHHEIELLHKVSRFCEEDETDLYESIYNAINEYIETDVRYGKLFLI